MEEGKGGAGAYRWTGYGFCPLCPKQGVYDFVRVCPKQV